MLLTLVYILKYYRKKEEDVKMLRKDYPRAERIISHDNVNNPRHYTDGNIEVIDFIEDKKLGFHLGNAVKYIARAGKKDPNKLVEDIKKAIWYLERYIKKLESNK